MSFTSWLREFQSVLAPNQISRKHLRQRPLRAAMFQPRLELLEDRTTPSFSSAMSYPVGTGPHSAVTADFNGDSRADVAVANVFGSSVSVLLGNAEGTFQPALTSATGYLPLSLAAGDFNNDGKFDLVTVGGGELSVLLGNGDGTFQASPIGPGLNPASVAVGDFNADSNLDLVVASSVYYSDIGWADVLLGNGDGTFQPAQTFTTGSSWTSPSSTRVAVADFNTDGMPDIVTANDNWSADNGTVSVLLGNGDGAFQPALDYATGAGSSSVAVGDFNGDGRPDLATANVGASSVSVLLGNGLGSFGAAQDYAVGVNPWAVAVADFNGDGKLDVVTVSDGEDLRVLLGNGDGAFQPALEYAGGALSVALADFNGDSLPDMAVSLYGANEVSVRINDGIWPELGAPSISINDVTVTEGNTGTVDATFTLMLSAAYGQPVTVHYETADGSATGGGDYTSGSGDIIFAAGETSKPLTVLVNGDRLPEGSESLSVRLSATNAFFADATAVGTILDDEPAISIEPYLLSGAEGNTGTTAFTFTVALSVAYDAPVTVDYATADLTAEQAGWFGMLSATAGDDYAAASGTLTFAAGETSQTITVLVNGDRLYEGNECFLVDLGNATTNAFLADEGAVGAILDDEPSISIEPYLSRAEGNTGTTAFTFAVALSVAYDAPVTVDYATADGSSTLAGGDYQATSGTLIFGAGETSKTVTVLVNCDTLYESDESFFVNLASPTNAVIAGGSGTGIILNDDPTPPTMVISDVSVTEGNTGAVNATFTVSLSAAYGQPATVRYETANGSATAGGDYGATSGILTIPAGQTSGTIAVLVNGDRLGEPNETIFLNLSSPTNATIADGQGQGTILDDEARVSINDVTRTEGNSGLTAFAFTVSLSVAYDVPVTVGYATADGTTTAGIDYQPASDTLTILAGQSSGTITVLVNGDRLGEPNETFFINLSNLNYGVIANGQGVGTIIDDEPRISISDVTKKEGNGKKTTLFVFTVTLSAAYDQAVTMSFQTFDGTAKTSDSDYVAKTGMLTFAPGETTKTITIEVNGDNKQEANETFYLDLFGNSGNSLFTKNRGIGTILNDD